MSNVELLRVWAYGQLLIGCILILPRWSAMTISDIRKTGFRLAWRKASFRFELAMWVGCVGLILEHAAFLARTVRHGIIAVDVFTMIGTAGMILVALQKGLFLSSLDNGGRAWWRLYLLASVLWGVGLPIAGANWTLAIAAGIAWPIFVLAIVLESTRSSYKDPPKEH